MKCVEKKTNAETVVRLDWDPKSRRDRIAAHEAVTELLRRGYSFLLDSPVQLHKLRGRKGPPESFYKAHASLEMGDLLMVVVASDDLASIMDYLALIGCYPMIHTSRRTNGKGLSKHDKFVVNIGHNEPTQAIHANITQAAINAVLAWDRKGRP